MAALEPSAGRVFSACRNNLVRIAEYLREHASTALPKVSIVLDKLVENLSNAEALDNLDFVLFELDGLLDSDYSFPLDAEEMHGISVRIRLNDVAQGLRILSEHLEFDRQLNSREITSGIASLYSSAQPIPVQDKISQLQERIRLGAQEYRDIALDQPRIPRLEEFGEKAERVGELVEQLRLAGETTYNVAVENVVHALDDLQHDHNDFLATGSGYRLRQVFDAATSEAQELYTEAFWTDDDELTVTRREQALAPFQFAISDDQLTLQPQPTHPKTGSDHIVAGAARALRAQAEDLADDLANSNHPRLFRAFNRLRDALNDGSNVVEIGMLCSTLDGQIRAASDELSETLLALLLSFDKSVMDFASQFEEWQQFSDNAAEASFEPQDGENYTKIARVLAVELERRQEVDSKVTEALLQVAEWNEKTDSPRSRLSLGRTVLNIIAVCFNELVKKPAQIALGVAGTAFVAVVLHQAALHAAEISRTPEGAWLRPAVRVIENHVGKLETP